MLQCVAAWEYGRSRVSCCCWGRYDANDDGLIERAEFENAILNGIVPKVRSGFIIVLCVVTLVCNSAPQNEQKLLRAFTL